MHAGTMMTPHPLRIGLIPGNAFCIVVDAQGPDAPRVEFDALAHPGSDERSRLGAALRRHTSVLRHGDVLEVYIGDCVVARIQHGQLVQHRPLTAFGARYLAENGVPLASGPLHHAASAQNPGHTLLRTDLHCHFAGCLSGHDLLALGLNVDAVMPHAMLAQAGIFCETDTPLTALATPAQARLANALDIALDRQVTFLDMERHYALRAPLTRHPQLFQPQLWRIAQRAAEQGVHYLELSLSSVLEPVTLASAHAALPLIEAQTGVVIRFLLALSRHDDLEWDLDVLHRAKACLHSRAVVGVDFMGHETNSTRAFLPQLAAAAKLAELRPGWVVRVHAGENPAFPENVREAVSLLRPWVLDHGLELRIGHGLYGVDDDTLRAVADLACAARPGGGCAVFEFNLTSNLALNNIKTTFDVPLRRVMAAGVDVVLGTDGAGLYSTQIQDEAQAARATSLDDAAIEQIAAVEQRLLANKRKAERQLPAWSDFVVPPTTPPLHFTQAFAAHKRAQASASQQALQSHVQALGLPLYDAPRLRARLAHRPVLSLAGAWRNSYALLQDHDIDRLRAFFEALLLALAPRGGVILTGGTRDGVEGLLHRCASSMAAPRAEVIALISANVPLDSLEPQGLNGLHVLSDTLYSKAAPLYTLVQECGGMALFVGGGVIVADEIQAARNLGVHYCLVDDIAGAAAKAAQQDSGHALSVLQPVPAAQQVLDRLGAGPHREPLFYAGANDAVDMVVLRKAAPDQEPQLLLVRRHDDAPAENGRFALPGGFVLPGETLLQAAVRELAEETSLQLAPGDLQAVAVVEGAGRDPRNTPQRWVRSHLFVVQLNGQASPNNTLVAGSDTSRAFFVALSRRPQSLAFDHDQLLAMALLHISSVDVQQPTERG